MTDLSKRDVWNDMTNPDFIRTFPNRTAEFIAEQAATIKALLEALDGVMIGGNHLAGLLPMDNVSYESDPATALEQMGSGMDYEVWCCWRSIMRARDAVDTIAPSTKETT